MTPFLVGLTLAASLSPLLTFAHLFQLKEWRWDRLREHLRSEGWIVSIFGRVRPIVVIGGISLLQVLGFRFPFGLELRAERQVLGFYILGTLTFLNIVQAFIRKQPYPVWTRKAITLVGTSLVIDLSLVFALPPNTNHLTPIIVLLQPLVLALALSLILPIDYTLKQRILARARALRTQFPDLVVIGITGSVGKTTTKELLAHILGEKAVATPEHVNTELGVAQWLIERLKPMCHGEPVEPSHRLSGVSTLRQAQDDTPPTFVVEMGAYREGEIRTLCSIVQPTMGIITNIGTQHIGLFGSQRAIMEAKGELFAALPENGHAFLITTTPFAQELQQKCQCPLTTVGTEGTPADMQATHVEETREGLRFHIHATSFAVPLHGEHQLGNILLAVAIAEALGMALEDIAQKLRTFQPPSHTFSLREEHGIHILDDTHNASPESLRAAMEWAQHQPYTPKILMTPGIIEQGTAAARLHFQCGTLAKDIFDDVYILNKKFAQFFAEGFGKPVPYHLPVRPRRPGGPPTTYHLAPGSLLVCVGRVPQNIIQKFLP